MLQPAKYLPAHGMKVRIEWLVFAFGNEVSVREGCYTSGNHYNLKENVSIRLKVQFEELTTDTVTISNSQLKWKD
uniref:Bm511 n=1 Tax=Brugia malayi TaxID=6279 RepID=A0A1I9G0D4_BRUMA|nr:Bm511 [Brugia malayi]